MSFYYYISIVLWNVDSQEKKCFRDIHIALHLSFSDKCIQIVKFHNQVWKFALKKLGTSTSVCPQEFRSIFFYLGNFRMGTYHGEKNVARYACEWLEQIAAVRYRQEQMATLLQQRARPPDKIHIPKESIDDTQYFHWVALGMGCWSWRCCALPGLSSCRHELSMNSILKFPCALTNPTQTATWTDLYITFEIK